MGKISDVGGIRSSQNLADGLTKYDKSEPLIDFIESGRLDTQVEQLVIREDVEVDTPAFIGDDDEVYKGSARDCDEGVPSYPERETRECGKNA